MSTTSDFIPLCVPQIEGNEWQYVKDCLDTGWVSSVGQYVDQFERQFAQYLGMPDAVATANGTSALHIALLVGGVRPNDEVLVSTVTFIAPVNAITYVGAHPILVDAEPTYWEMDVEKVRQFLSEQCTFEQGEVRNKATGRRVSAILPVHILGNPIDLDPLIELAHAYHLTVIEDATESLGATYKGRMVGTFGDVACFSFNGNKLLTTGGGGMIVSRHPEWTKRAKYLTTQAKDDPLEYIHGEVGYNYRLTNIQAALGVAQLELIERYLLKKRQIATLYNETLQQAQGITLMPEAPWTESALWMYTILIDETAFGMSSREVLTALGKENIQTRPLWQPIHLSPAYPNAQHIGGDVAERLFEQALSLPCSVGLSTADQERVIDALLSLGHRA